VKHILYFLVMGWAFIALSRALPGFHVDGWGPAILAAIVLALANTLIKPILFVLTLPLTILTLGFFLLVLNALMLWLTDVLVPGFRVQGFGTLLIGSLLLALVGMVWKAIAREE
jgi:putative membrane protein